MIGRDATSIASTFRFKAWLSFLLLACSVLLHSPTGQAQNSLAAALQQQSEFLPVREAYRLDGAVTADGQLRLHWQIAEGYYLYQHMFTVRHADASTPTNLSIDFPPALDKTDEFFGDVSVYYDEADLAVSLPDGEARLTLAVTYQGCADAGLCYPPETEHLLVDVDTGAVTPTAFEPQTPRVANTPSTGPNMTFLLALGLAFPRRSYPQCHALRVPHSLAQSAELCHRRSRRAPPARPRVSAGVVASFVLIASVLISLQSAGRWVGWGFQLQSTGFVIGLAYLFAVMGLSLSGLVLFGGRWMNLGAGLATAPGARGSFFTGVLAVVVASPCTAPFMGSALGYALTQPAFAALAVFAALGVGMATPMVAISMSDTARRWLPKPGAWMETLKQVMAFPLYLTAVWLLWVAGKQSGVDTMAAAAAGLVMLALGLTLIRGGATARVVGLICMVSAVMLGGVRGDATASIGKGERDGIVAWSPERLQTLRAQGTPVFVDVTADWCITCLANEQAVLFTDDMTRAFETAGVTYMVADWTNYDPDIGAFVREHGRNGIPLYVMYPGNLSGTPTILPQLLTANIVTEALASVSR